VTPNSDFAARLGRNSTGLYKTSRALGGMLLNETPVESPWVKDYDAIKAEGPTRWPKRFDTSSWGHLAACDGGDRIGGAVVAFNTPGLHMLEGASDIAILWDLRVHPQVRSSGVGSALFQAVEEWSRRRADEPFGWKREPAPDQANAPG
jgi:GNAT superfamily N-acetyltransferase